MLQILRIHRTSCSRRRSQAYALVMYGLANDHLQTSPFLYCAQYHAVLSSARIAAVGLVPAPRHYEVRRACVTSICFSSSSESVPFFQPSSTELLAFLRLGGSLTAQPLYARIMGMGVRAPQLGGSHLMAPFEQVVPTSIKACAKSNFVYSAWYRRAAGREGPQYLPPCHITYPAHDHHHHVSEHAIPYRYGTLSC